MLVFCYSAVRHDLLKLYSRHLVRLVLLQTLSCVMLHKPKFCRDVASILKIYIYFLHSRVIEFCRCRSLQQRWRDDDGKHLPDRCHVCWGRIGDLQAAGQQRRRWTYFQTAAVTAAGIQRQTDVCAGHKVAPTEGEAVVCCLYHEWTATPFLSSHTPQNLLVTRSLLPIPKGVSFPKIWITDWS